MIGYQLSRLQNTFFVSYIDDVNWDNIYEALQTESIDEALDFIENNLTEEMFFHDTTGMAYYKRGIENVHKAQ